MVDERRSGISPPFKDWVLPADEVEQELPAGLSEGQIAEFVEDDMGAAQERTPTHFTAVAQHFVSGRSHAVQRTRLQEQG